MRFPTGSKTSGKVAVHACCLSGIERIPQPARPARPSPASATWQLLLAAGLAGCLGCTGPSRVHVGMPPSAAGSAGADDSGGGAAAETPTGERASTRTKLEGLSLLGPGDMQAGTGPLAVPPGTTADGAATTSSQAVRPPHPYMLMRCSCVRWRQGGTRVLLMVFGLAVFGQEHIHSPHNGNAAP
jgi:hypothetical protein